MIDIIGPVKADNLASALSTKFCDWFFSKFLVNLRAWSYIKKENTFANNAKKYPYSSHTEAREIEEINIKYTIFSLLILSVCFTSDVL